jgi:translation initiation factor IF-2
MSIFSKPDETKKTPIIIKKAPIIIKKTPKDEEKWGVLETKKEVGNDWFFSGLGFKKKIEPEIKTKEISKTSEQQLEEKKQESAKQSTEDFFSQATQIAKRNAVVIRSTQQHEKPQRPQWGWARTNNNRTSGSNISFGKGERKNKNNNWHTNNRQQQHNNNIVKKEPVIQKVKVIKEAAVSGTLTKKENIIIKGVISVKEFSEKSGIPFPDILKHMLANKILWGINTALDFDTVSLIAAEFGVEVSQEEKKISVDTILAGDLNAILAQDKDAKEKLSRPPIVTVMGHVDHGKTSLLDYLRKTTIASWEAGGITQSIGASKIVHNGHHITFIDTPGHELFTNLRARGAKVTNIAVIVVAADDGMKPQTIESINHAKEAGVPIIIAVTKIDKPENKMEQILSEMGVQGLIPEARGWETPVIGVSSKSGEGMDKLLDQILFQSELLDLQYDPNRKAVGVIIDARKDAKQGVLTSLIVLSGTLKVGDIVVVHNTYGKIRKMINAAWQATRTATGGDPVQILGINEIPEPGRVIEVVENEKEAQQRIELINDSLEKNSVSTLGTFLEQMKKNEGAVLKIVCKSSGPSSLEAMNQALSQIPLPKNVSLKVIHSGVGDIIESDIGLAQASGAIVLWFNINCSGMMKKRADSAKVSVKNFEIIYQLTDYIEQTMKDMVEKEYREVERGKLKILAVFFRKDKMMIIGGKVIEGKIGNGMKFRVNLENAEDPTNVPYGEITSLQRETNSVKEVAEGYECGMKVKVSKKVSEGDILTFYEMEEIIDNN